MENRKKPIHNSMSGELFQWQQLVTLESSKVESIVLSSEWITPSRNAVDGTDLDHLHLFVSLKGGKLFQYSIYAEARNGEHTVRNEVRGSVNRDVNIRLQIQYPRSRARRRFRRSFQFSPFPRCTFSAVGFGVAQDVDGVLSAFDYNNLTPVFCDIKATNILDVGINFGSKEAIPELWVLQKKLLLLFEFSDGQFRNKQSLPLVDTPLQTCWQDNVIYLQFKDHVTELDATTGQNLREVKLAVKVSSPLPLQPTDAGVLYSSAPNIL